MSFYTDVILPKLLDRAMRVEDLAPYRRRVIGAAHGRVLEIGIGSGLNLPFYGAATDSVTGLEPSSNLIEMASHRAAGTGGTVAFVKGSAEAIPFDAGCFDTVVTTWTMCSIPRAEAALAEIRRVLRPGGDLLFAEHGRAPDPGVTRLQDWLTPAWRPLAGGCHLNRPIARMIESAGFTMVDLKTGYAERGPRPFTFMYEGLARPG
jgi:ubiquinone/menaquinone biosynthesis C-methylase UbiE